MLTDKARPILARILDLSTEVRAESFAGLSDAEGHQLIELLRRAHGNLSHRVPLLDDLDDLDTPEGPPERRVAAASAADLSLVGGRP